MVSLSSFPVTAQGKEQCWGETGSVQTLGRLEHWRRAAGRVRGEDGAVETQADPAAEMFQKLCRGPAWMHSLTEIPKYFLPIF